MRALTKYAPDDFSVTNFYTRDSPWNRMHEFDLFFNLDYMSHCPKAILDGYQGVYVISHNRDSKSRLEYFPDSYKPAKQHGWLVINNLECFEYHARLPFSCNISNGYDPDLWKLTTPIELRDKRVLWTGGANPKKGKGWYDILEPMIPILEEKGFTCDFRPFPTGGDLQSWAYPQPRQLEWYNSGVITLCTSEHEGTPNTTLEGAACGCVPVSTHVGNIREFGKHGENCVICERSIDAFVDGIEHAYKNLLRLSAGAQETMRDWSYGFPGHRDQYFYQLFRRLIFDGRDTITPFTYSEIRPEDI